MSVNKTSFEDSLVANVIKLGKCLACGTCVVCCPFNCLKYGENEPRLIKECKVCGICEQTCPQYQWSWPKAENYVFGKERKVEETFGVYRRLVIARATDERILKMCQDGGVATALLLFALKNGLVDGAVAAGINMEKPLCPTPSLVTTPEEILACAGTKYSYSPSIFALAEGVKQKKTRIAFVGTSCQIHAIRKMQMSGMKKYTAPIKFLIGLMCSECFTYEGLMEKHIHEKLGVNLNDVRKINIKGKMIVTTNSGVTPIPLTEIKQYARENCGPCDDFSSELADISVGGLGLSGWTFTIIRTENGEELFLNAEKAGVIKTREAGEEMNALNLLRKLSEKKRQILNP